MIEYCEHCEIPPNICDGHYRDENELPAFCPALINSDGLDEDEDWEESEEELLLGDYDE